MNTNVKTLHKMVWEFRDEIEPYFPTPDQHDSLAFAVTEAAEALDAQLRCNPRYKRNNSKDHTVERELAQCAMMLLTAVPYTWRDWKSCRAYAGIYEWKLQFVVLRCAEHYAVNHGSYDILRTVHGISTMIDLTAHLTAELNRMRAKHLPA